MDQYQPPTNIEQIERNTKSPIARTPPETTNNDTSRETPPPPKKEKRNYERSCVSFFAYISTYFTFKTFTLDA